MHKHIKPAATNGGAGSSTLVKATPLAAAIWALFCMSGLAIAQEATEKMLPRIDVIGDGEEAIANIPGAVGIVTKEELQLLQPMSTEAALKAVPGVVIKPEEESAVVANIGIRGLSAADYKTLILEDGVPVAPGLFVGNGRYYNPRIQRMESIEVLKGAGSLRYGPNTIGGVINYKTKEPEQGVALTGKVGTFGYRELMLEAGGSAPSGEAKGGINIATVKSDGFQSKGFEMNDVMVKGGMALGDKQWISAKFTHYDNTANISYRGLFLDDFKKGATYNPAPDDFFLTERNSFDINHDLEINSQMRVKTLVYWSQMYRDYWRFDLVPGTPTVGGRWNYSDVVNGNNRAFERKGVDSRLHIQHSSFGIKNDTELGVRMDQETMDDVKIVASRTNPRSGTLSTDKVQSASSVALFAQNRFIFNDQLAVTPGLRIESYEQKYVNKRDTSQNGSTNNTEVMPGVGATYKVSHAAQVYGGVYKAFGPALNSDAIASDGTDQRLEAERSTNYEIGVRGAADKWRYEAALFLMDFDNQIIPSNSGGFVSVNGGKTMHRGMEAAVAYDFGSGYSVASNLTYIPVAKFVGDRFDSSGNFDFASGNRVTYTPELVANMSFGYKSGALRSALVVSHISSQFTDPENTTTLAENTSGFFTGKIDAYTLVGLNAHYTVDKKLTVFGAIKNLTDERYIASLRQGIYAGVSRSFEVGMRYKF